MEERKNLVYVRASYTNDVLEGYVVEVIKPMRKFLRDVQFYKENKDAYSVDDFVDGYKVIVAYKDEGFKSKKHLFVCSSSDINNYL